MWDWKIGFSLLSFLIQGRISTTYRYGFIENAALIKNSLSLLTMFGGGEVKLFNYFLHLLFCCCNHDKLEAPLTSVLRIKFFSPQEGLNEAFFYATTIKFTMASIQFAALCDGRKHAELVFLIPKHKWQSVHWPSGARSGQGLCPKWDPEMSGIYSVSEYLRLHFTV